MWRLAKRVRSSLRGCQPALSRKLNSFPRLKRVAYRLAIQLRRRICRDETKASCSHLKGGRDKESAKKTPTVDILEGELHIGQFSQRLDAMVMG